MVNITERIENNVITLFFDGNLDENTYQSVEARLNKALAEEAETIRLNMKNVKYISSIGIRSLMVAYNSSIKSGKKIYIDKNEISIKAREILDVVGVLTLFTDKKEDHAN